MKHLVGLNFFFDPIGIVASLFIRDQIGGKLNVAFDS
jgi:hypothetical protein